MKHTTLAWLARRAAFDSPAAEAQVLQALCEEGYHTWALVHEAEEQHLRCSTCGARIRSGGIKALDPRTPRG